MGILLVLVPILTIVAGLILYGRNGRGEILKMDSVQFIYAFVLSPIFFIWAKTFLNYLMKNDPDLIFTQGQMFLIDTSFSTFFYVFLSIYGDSLAFKKLFNKKKT